MTVLESALLYASYGYQPLPILPGTKRAAVRWRTLQSSASSATDQPLHLWFATNNANLALLCGNESITVIDIDSSDPAVVDLVQSRCGTSPMICRTPSGGRHLYYRSRRVRKPLTNTVKTKNLPIDIRSAGSYVVAPPSRVDSRAYVWESGPCRLADLPVIRLSWLRPREPARYLKTIEFQSADDTRIRRARAYVRHIEGAISGEHGHARTMRVAGVLIQKFELSVEEALPIFLHWNQSCQPPWTEKELLHKLESAYKRKRCH